jgi:hypothetical protein
MKQFALMIFMFAEESWRFCEKYLQRYGEFLNTHDLRQAEKNLEITL